MARINRRGRKSLAPEIVLTPLIDTALTLLVIFIMTAPMVQNGIKVDLPQGNSKEVGEQQELVVTLSKEGKLFFNSFPVEMNGLADVVKNAMNGRPDVPIYVRADECIEYGKVIEVVDMLKMSGAKYVAMSTRVASKKS
jgi:biopolymer transport protein TolR